VLHHNIRVAEMQQRLDGAHSRVVDAESALVRLNAELAAKTIMFGNIRTYVSPTCAVTIGLSVRQSYDILIPQSLFQLQRI